MSVKHSSTEIAVLPLRDVVIYPRMVMPLFVGRNKSVKALEASVRDGNKHVFLVTQKQADIDNPRSEDLYKVGTKAIVLQLLKLPDGTVKVLIEGERRATIKRFIDYQDYFAAEIKEFSDQSSIEAKASKSSKIELQATCRSTLALFEQYAKLNKKIPSEVLNSLEEITDASYLADTIAAHLNLKLADKQELLEIRQAKVRLEKLLFFIESEIDLLKIEKRIRVRVDQQMKKSQHEYYLNEQMKAIQKELGDLGDGTENELEAMRTKITHSGMPAEAEKKATTELNKLKTMPAMSAEATVVRNYLDWMLSVPWKEESKVVIDLTKARKVLDEQHYALDKVKERFVEYLAVQQRISKIKGSILCLVGPPGVGKTSLGRSIAEATGREFVRVSLGGMRDEAEIRGHRRTYIGAMPGKIIQKLAKVKVKNPLFVLDEIDKMAMDFRGDPASALLEVLDPEQNHAFNDHYLEVDYDLSSVMFIATANTLDIPSPLLDRMETIRLSGYTEDEKIHIATKHLLSKQFKANGLKRSEANISVTALRDIVRYYTREAGVRNLERDISKICRKVVKEIVTVKAPKKTKKVNVTSKNLEQYLGVRAYHYGVADKDNQIGQVTGLAWTEVGGELLKIEATAVSGKGKVTLTGQLGEVMQESIQAAMTVVRADANRWGVKDKYFESHDIHVHLPEGAVPKDGPSAGVGMCTALVSMMAKLPVRANMAMTGEVTLRGEILPIGGLKEKLLAALRGGITEVLIPKENVKDLKEIPKNVKEGLNIHPVQWVEQVLDRALIKPSIKKTTATKTKRASKPRTKKSIKK